MIEIIPIFAIPLMVDHIGHLITDDVVQYTKDLEYEPVHIGNGDWSNSKAVLDHEAFADIKKVICNNVKKLAKDVYLIDDDIEFHYGRSWTLKHSYGHHCVMHNHTGSIFSGVLYIDASENSGDIVFHNASAMGCSHSYHQISLPLTHTKFNAYNTPHYTVPSVTGTLLIFSSGLSHSVKPNLSNRDRYSLSFNVFPKGMIGMKELILS